MLQLAEENRFGLDGRNTRKSGFHPQTACAQNNWF